MRFEEATLSSYVPKTKFVVVCHEGDRDEVVSIVDAYAPLDWQQQLEIRVLETGSRLRFRNEPAAISGNVLRREIKQDRRLLQQTLNSIAPPSEAAKIVTIGRKYSDLVRTNFDDWRTIVPLSTLAEFRGALPTLLSNSGLDWMSRVVRFAEHYHTETVDREAIAEWRAQFELAGCKWIADALLKLLDFWPSVSVCDSLFDAPSNSGLESQVWLESYDSIVFNEARSGSSSAVVTRFAKKRFGDLLEKRRADIVENIQKGVSAGRMLFLEDCLMTGSEIIKLFDGIGLDVVRHCQLDLRFATGTVFGQRRLQTYLDNNSLSTIRILPPAAGFLANLTEAGLAAANTGSLLAGDFELANPNQDIITGINLRGRRVFNSDQRKQIARCCRRIGVPLMRIHLERKGFDPARLARLLPDWGLGPSGLGLLTVFAHGAPKPALPLLWLGGDVDVVIDSDHYFKGTWKPLFR